MKINLNIDPSLEEERVDFNLIELTPQISKIINEIGGIHYKIWGVKNGKKFLLEPKNIIRILAQDKKIIVYLKSENFYMNSSLISLEEKLPMYFLRISNSEIINVNYLSSIEYTFSGKIKIYFKNDDFTYSSRSYLKRIKEYFHL